VGNRLVFAVQAICVVVAAVALYELKYSGQWGLGISTDKALALFSGKDLEYEGGVRHQNGTRDVRSKGPALKYSVNSPAYGSALAALDRSDFTGAERALRDILTRTPDEPSTALALGTTLYLQRRYEESAGVFQKLLEQEPHFPNVRAALGATLEAQGRHTDSIEQYSLALGDDPTFALSYYGRGVSYSHIGKRVEAEADLKKTLDLLPATAELATMAREQLAALAKQSAGARN
jgi:predicted Zn-dependent protease